MLRASFQHLGKGESALRRTRLMINALTVMPRMVEELTATRCEVGQRLAERLGLAPGVQEALGQVYERWDGKGWPNRLKGEALQLPVRVVQLAHNAHQRHPSQDGEQPALSGGGPIVSLVATGHTTISSQIIRHTQVPSQT